MKSLPSLESSLNKKTRHLNSNTDFIFLFFFRNWSRQCDMKNISFTAAGFTFDFPAVCTSFPLSAEVSVMGNRPQNIDYIPSNDGMSITAQHNICCLWKASKYAGKSLGGWGGQVNGQWKQGKRLLVHI